MKQSKDSLLCMHTLLGTYFPSIWVENIQYLCEIAIYPYQCCVLSGGIDVGAVGSFSYHNPVFEGAITRPDQLDWIR